jgi:hypothetical protein
VIYLLALIPATVLTIAGYFVLVLSTRAEGALRTFGKYLGFWAFTLAGLVILGALFAAAHHGAHHCPYMTCCHGMGDMHEGMYCPWSSGMRSGMEEREGEGRGPAAGANPPENSNPAASPHINN